MTLNLFETDYMYTPKVNNKVYKKNTEYKIATFNPVMVVL